jgi:protein O-GlcNAc transferase
MKHKLVSTILSRSISEPLDHRMVMQHPNRAERRRRRKQAAAPSPVRSAATGGLAAAIERHKRGEFEIAEHAYREILAAAPDNPDTLHLLGIVRFQQGDAETAAALIARAIEQNGENADYFANLGAALQKLGRAEEAEIAYRRALSRNPTLIEALTNLAIICHEGKRLDEASDCCRRALAIQPTLLKALRKLVDVLFEQGKVEEAQEPLERIVRMDPLDAANRNNLGFAYDSFGRTGDAIECYRRAVEIAPNQPEYLNNLGTLLRRIGHTEEGDHFLDRARSVDHGHWKNELHRGRWCANVGDYKGAIAALLPKAEEGSEDPELLMTLGAVLSAERRFKEAHRWLVKALEIKPDHAEAMFRLGGAFLGMKEGWQAECAFRKAVQLRPGYVEPHLSICEIMDVQQRRDEANIWARAAIHLRGFVPGYMVFPFKAFRASCDFDAIESLGDIWDAAAAALHTNSLSAVFLYLLVEAGTIENSRRLTALHRAFAEQVESRAGQNPLPPLAPVRRQGKLRVGLLSYDLRNHSVAKFVLPLLRNYDRESLELTAYSLLQAPDDPVQAEIRGLVDRFVDVEIEADRELAASVREDGIDVMVDLGGFTVGSRLNAMAYRMAPIQLAWLGYPYSPGFEAVDYMLLDPQVAPTMPELSIEKPLCVPHSWVCFEGFREAPIDPTPPSERNGYVTFGTLNNTYKFSQGCISAWAEVMHRVPNSRFMLVRPTGQSRIIAENMIKAFGRHGIAPERLFIRTNAVNQHLECYNEIDVALDTFPLTGGTTTCDALWMGVPTVTLRGPAMHQRLSHSLLNSVKLGELSAESVDRFVDMAAHLAAEPEALRLLRTTLREVVKNSPLCRGDIFASGIRDALWQAARERGIR